MRSNCKLWMLAAAGFLSAAQALAGQHFICYEGPHERRGTQTVLKAVAGCHDDDPAVTCNVQMAGASHWGTDTNAGTSAQRVSSIGSFRYFEFLGSGASAGATLDLEATFGKRTLSCRVQALGTLSGNGGAADGLLTGFSSDSSGLVSTGVWRITLDGGAAALRVPGDFLAVGGGFESVPGAFVHAANYNWQAPGRAWQALSRTDTLDSPKTTTAYAIGLRVQGLHSERELAPKMSLQTASSSMQAPKSAPRVELFAAPDQVVVGGAVRAVGNQFRLGQFITTTAPAHPLPFLRCVVVGRPCTPPEPEGWDAESKDQAGQHPGHVELEMLTLPRMLTVNGQDYEVRARHVHSTSLPGYQSSVVATGLRGEFAVTNVGARTLWATYNPGGNPATSSSRLTEVAPRLDLGGAQASVNHGSSASLAAVTAYANGIKLVPVGTPPDLIENPWKDLKIDVGWWCTVDSRLDGTTELCRLKGKQLLASEVCSNFKDLQEFGYCRP